MKLRYLNDELTLRQDSGKCTGCGVCLDVCPHSVWRLEGRKAVIADLAACMECGACAKNCIAGAIYVHSGVGCARAVINGIISGTEPCCDGKC
ncbi:MAG: 4Fe-4S binding protein [Planctomycetaceae bacterium]|jgi:NAD-dependent dihydropyrimidine dehydrogenase PreA subunit|nr:4Fe-4S binding protein [Planctomycetaceae bacterium]